MTLDIIDHEDKRYEVVAIIPSNRIDDIETIKKNYGATIVFSRNAEYYFCREILEAEFEESKKEGRQ